MKSLLMSMLYVVLFFVVVGFSIKYLEKNKQKIVSPQNNSSKTIFINSKVVNIEISDDDQKRSLGLSNRDSLGENDGMLFIFDKNDIIPSFWMKDMRFAIDIVWINDAKIVKIDSNVLPPEPNTITSNLVLYKPDSPIDHVLEVNAGFCEKHNIKVGDTINLDNI